MDHHPLTDEESVQNLEKFLQGSSEHADQLRAADLGNATGFNPEIQFSLSSACDGGSWELALSSGVSHQNRGTDVLPKESADETLLFGPEGAVRTSVRRYECIKQHSNSTSGMRSDYSLQRGHSSVGSSERPVPVLGGLGISSKKGANLDAPNEDGTHGVCCSSIDRNSQAFAAASRNGYEVTMPELPKPSCVKSLISASDVPGTNRREGNTSADAPKQDKLDCVYDSNYSYGEEISLAYAAPSRNEYNLTMLEPKSLSANASALELADRGSGRRNGATVDASNADGTHGVCASSRYRNSQAFAAASRNEYEVTAQEPKPPSESIFLASPGPGTNQRELYTLVEAPKQGNMHCVHGSNDSGKEISLAYAAPSRNEYNLTTLKPKSLSANPSVPELPGPDPGSGSQNGAKRNSLKDGGTYDVLGMNDSYRTGISGSPAAPSRNAYKFTMAKQNLPDEISSLEIPGTRTSTRKGTALEVPQCSGNIGLNETFREGTCRSFLSPYEYAMPASKPPLVESSVLDLADPGTCPLTEATLAAPEQDENCGISDSNDFVRKEISRFLAVPSRIEYNMAMPEPKPLLVKSSLPGTSPRKCLTLFAPKKDGSHGVPDSNDDIGEAISQFFASASRIECELKMAEPKSPPHIAGPGSCLQTDAALVAAKQDGPSGVCGSNTSFLEELSLVFAAPDRNDHNLPMPEQESTFAEDPDLESGGSATIPQDGTEREIILPESYESFRNRILPRACWKREFGRRENAKVSKGCSIS